MTPRRRWRRGGVFSRSTASSPPAAPKSGCGSRVAVSGELTASWWPSRALSPISPSGCVPTKRSRPVPRSTARCSSETGRSSCSSTPTAGRLSRRIRRRATSTVIRSSRCGPRRLPISTSCRERSCRLRCRVPRRRSARISCSNTGWRQARCVTSRFTRVQSTSAVASCCTRSSTTLPSASGPHLPARLPRPA